VTTPRDAEGSDDEKEDHDERHNPGGCDDLGEDDPGGIRGTWCGERDASSQHECDCENAHPGPGARGRARLWPSSPAA
jgi:hypothetical protein